MEETNTIILTATQKATKAMETAAKALDLTAFASEAANLSEQVAISTIKLNDLETEYVNKTTSLEEEYVNKLRRAKIDLGFSIEENETAELSKLLVKNGLESITSDDLETLKIAAVNNEVTTEQAIESAVKSAEGKLHGSYKAQIASINGEHRVSVAQTEAELKSLKSEIEFLKAGLAQAQANLAADRQAQIEMSANASQPTINVTK